MISISGMSGIVALQLVNATEQKDQELIRKAPQHAREIDYFLDNIGDVENVEDLTEDYRLYSFVMKAYDLEDQIFGKAMMEKVLKSDPLEPSALVNRLTDQRFKDFHKAMGFGPEGVGNRNTLNAAWKTAVVNKYVDTQYVNGKNDESETIGTVLEFRRKAASIDSPFDILRDSDLSEFFRTAFGLPEAMAGIDIDRQAAVITEKLDLSTLSDPEVVEDLVKRYVAIRDATSNTAVRSNAAVTLLSGALGVGSGSYIPATIDIEAIQGFGGYRRR
ncbi:DUF1217 domain-containing protein [Sagittula sp. NFXS13]|uniref:DUF1217 domain-containing protein n=1 Tax=Sagittula sp. NFXS13 TaxID=2819095 RepID=UPI0032E03627